MKPSAHQFVECVDEYFEDARRFLIAERVGDEVAELLVEVQAVEADR